MFLEKLNLAKLVTCVDSFEAQRSMVVMQILLS
jgi:hypothetical protein